MANYELWLTDDRGLRLAPLNAATSFTASRTVNRIGKLTMTLPASFDTTLIDVDRMVQVWRAPSGGTLSLWHVYFIRRWRYETSGDGEKLVVMGYGLNDLLRRRIVVAYDDDPEAAVSGYADDLMKGAVTYAMSDSTVPAPDAGTREWDDLSVAGDLGAGPTLSQQIAWKPLLTSSGGGILGELSKASMEAGTEVWFDVVPRVVASGSINFEFRTYTGQPGMDVSDRVVFGQDSGNLENPSLEYDYSKEVNYVYAGGKGEGAARAVHQVYDSSRYLASQWNRREMFASATSKDLDDQIREAGRAKLKDGRPIKRFSGRPIDTHGTRFGREWNFGDKVKAKYREEEFDCIVESVVLNVSRGVEVGIGAESLGGGDVGYTTQQIAGDIKKRADWQAAIEREGNLKKQADWDRTIEAINARLESTE